MSSNNTRVNTSSGVMDTILGKTIVGQIVFAFIVTIVLFIILFSIERLMVLFGKYKNAKTFLVQNTLMSNRPRIIRQNPADRYAKTILASDNEMTGIEFTYTFFLYIEPSTINSADTAAPLKQVFYKGYSQPFPLLGPGVFIKGNDNVMRIFMNSYKNWFTYVDIPNIPLQKWFHVSLVCRKNNVEVYVNGNIKGRIDMSDTYPYQNYQDIVVFGGTTYPNRNTDAKMYMAPGANAPEPYKVGGAMAGMISRLSHYRYALSFAEIQNSVNEGPSSDVERAGDELYYNANGLKDTWWVAGQ